MPTPPDKTAPATAEDLRALLGEVDEEIAEEILALKPTIGDLEQAAAAMESEDETPGLSEAAAGIAEIMAAEEEDEEEDEEEPEEDEKEPKDKEAEDEKEDDKEDDDKEEDEEDDEDEKKKDEKKKRR
jgi:hypothetical protein